MRTALHASELDGKTLLFAFFFRQKSGVIALSFPFPNKRWTGFHSLLNRKTDRQTDRDKTLMIGGMRNVSVVFFLPRRYLQVLYMGRTVPLLLLLLLLLSPND